MGRRPTKAGSNVYCHYRLEAAKYDERLKSREKAAELLGLAPSTLADYELGITKFVPQDSVLRMIDLYNAPELKNIYCRGMCPLGADVPVLEIDSLDRITVRAASNMRKMEFFKEMLLDIAEDGIITNEERPSLGMVIDFLDEVSNIAQNLKAWAIKNLE